MSRETSIVASVALAVVSVVCLVAITVLLVNDKPVPEGFFALAGGSIGALAGLLAPGPRG